MRYCLLVTVFCACRSNKIIMVDDVAEVVDQDADGIDAEEDCDDLNASIGPHIEEICDGIDNNCDGNIDEGVLQLFYLDADLDGFGDPNQTIERCELPSGYVNSGNDCDDSDGEISPAASEYCDMIDNNCNGQIDEAPVLNGIPMYRDADGDGFGDPQQSEYACSFSEGYAAEPTDCDDTDPSIHPEAGEYCDGIDNNCDSIVDGQDAIDATEWFLDLDGDGFGTTAYSVRQCEAPPDFSNNSDDCDDAAVDIHPDAVEICDALDNNCDGIIDEEVDSGVMDTYYVDADGDGYGDDSTAIEACSLPGLEYVSVGGDCDDSDAFENPDWIWYTDADGDGYGDPNSSQDCERMSTNDVNEAGDCDDNDAQLYPLSNGDCNYRSCQHLLDTESNASSGTYTLYPTDTSPVLIQCDMLASGGWMRIVDVDYAVDACPGEWTAYGSNACQRDSSDSDQMASATFDAYGFSWDQIEFSLTAVALGTMDAWGNIVQSNATIEDTYVDGISLSIGSPNQREHVFTYAVAHVGSTYCPSNGQGNSISPQAFIGTDWVCGTDMGSGIVFAGDWYDATLTQVTTESLEIRLMSDQNVGNENVAVETVVVRIR